MENAEKGFWDQDQQKVIRNLLGFMASFSFFTFLAIGFFSALSYLLGTLL